MSGHFNGFGKIALVDLLGRVVSVLFGNAVLSVCPPPELSGSFACGFDSVSVIVRWGRSRAFITYL